MKTNTSITVYWQDNILYHKKTDKFINLVYGIEINENARLRARQRIADEQNLGEIPPGSPHALTMWDVIEHLPDPIKTLKCINADIVILSTPNTDVVRADRALPEWRHYKPGEHLWGFNKKSYRH